MFPLDRWYVAAFSHEIGDAPLARTLLDRPLVMFRDAHGRVAALDDRCCHRALPLSKGEVEHGALRCGYHGLLFDGSGRCIEIPGQDRIPPSACVPAHPVREQDRIVWIWFGRTPGSQPHGEPPRYPWHDDPRYEHRGASYHYRAPWQLVHDNLLDLSHLGYVHRKTIGGNARLHMGAPTTVTQDGDTVRVVRWMKDSVAPPTYAQAWPFRDRIDRWQEIEFDVSHLRIWTGAVDAGSEPLDDPQRGGFHMRGLHAVTPETATSTHYLWTIACNRPEGRASIRDLVYEQTAATFEEDVAIIESQWANLQRFGDRPMIDIHVDAAPNRARRIIARLCGAAGIEA